MRSASSRWGAAARARRLRRHRRRGSRGHRRSSAPRRAVPSAAAGAPAAPPRPRTPRANRPGSRRPGGTQPRRPSWSRRARRCVSRRPAGRRRAAALHREDRLLARDATGERGRTCADSRTTPGRAGQVGLAGRPPSTRAGRWRRHRPCCRSTRRPRARGRARRPARARARPRAPLWDEKPMFPAGNVCGANVALSPTRPRRCPGSWGRSGAPRALVRGRAAAPGAARPRCRFRRTRPR